MHFVSDLAGMKVVRPEKTLFSPANGEKMGVQSEVMMILERGKAPQWAVDQAVKHFSFAMRPAPGSIGGADVPAESWCVYIDTDVWALQHNHDDEVKARAEELLMNDSDYLQVEPPRITPPWPNYDALTITTRRSGAQVAERNLLTAEEIGVTVEELISYEEAVHGREDVLEVYRSKVETPEEEKSSTSVSVTA
jgi:hypothetical protein